MGGGGGGGGGGAGVCVVTDFLQETRLSDLLLH